MTTDEKTLASQLCFGLKNGVPEHVTALYGARWIFPDDAVWDRTDLVSKDDASKDGLISWLDAGTPDETPYRKARDQARRLADTHALLERDEHTVTLYEDQKGVIKANPQRSFGYLYVHAYLKPTKGVTT